MFYAIDSSRVSLAEYRWGTPLPAMPAAALLKLLRVRIPSSTDDPNVESLAPFEVAADAFPEDARVAMLPVAGELAELGFEDPILHSIHDPAISTRIDRATFTHRTGAALATIHRRVWSATSPPKVRQHVVFLSGRPDRGFVASSSGKLDLAWPAQVAQEHREAATTGELWARHRERIDLPPAGGTEPPREPLPAPRELLESHHAALRDFHLGRGVFVRKKSGGPDRALPAAAIAAGSASQTLAPAAEGRFAEEIVELERIEKGGSSWLAGLLLLVVSLALFVGLGGARWSWRFVLLLLPILLVHEGGHYVAMRLFDYRNVRMFFIPLFGAAVAGRNPLAPGWKRVLVSLAGPVPGILLALPVGLAGAAAGDATLLEAARLALVLNAFNLLPFLPLDGGWVLHSLLFSRHPIFDVAARVAAILGLFGLAFFFEDKLLGYFTIPLILGLPANLRVARAAADLRGERLDLLPGPGGLPPRPTLERIFERLTAPPAKPVPKKLVAQQAANVVDALGAEPPGALATVGLLALYGAAFVAALVIFVVLIFAGGDALLVEPSD